MASDAPKIIGRYALHRVVATGGMASVHLGRLLGAAGFSRTVAIKRLHAHCANDPEFTAMFLDEARLAARIKHPNVVPTLDVVALEDELLVVMEYVHGEALSRIWKDLAARGEKIPSTIALGIMAGALYGLHAAHEATDELGAPLRMVHRDVSPHNILVGADGVARVIDFGIAKARGRLHTTRDGTLRGKVAYMPIEQLRGEEVDRRADVFAAGVVLWEALTGKRLFGRADHAATIYAVMHDDPAPPSRFMDAPCPALDDALLTALAREKQSRFSSALLFAEALERAAPVANAREIAKWLETVARDSLRTRAVEVARIEAGDLAAGESTLTGAVVGGSKEKVSAAVAAVSADMDTVIDSRPPLVDEPTGSNQTPPPASSTRSVRRSRSFYVMAGASGAFLLVLLGGAIRLLVAGPSIPAAGQAVTSSSPSETATASVSPSTAASASSAATTTLVDASVAPPSPATSSSADGRHRDAPSPAVSARARPLPPPSSALTSAPASAKPTPPPDPCDPPYYVDKDGVRVVKRECLGKR